jgi:hypothetical protein
MPLTLLVFLVLIWIGLIVLVVSLCVTASGPADSREQVLTPRDPRPSGANLMRL